jgi:hypothetical protein
LLKAILLVCLYSTCSVVCVVCNHEQMNWILNMLLWHEWIAMVLLYVIAMWYVHAEQVK